MKNVSIVLSDELQNRFRSLAGSDASSAHCGDDISAASAHCGDDISAASAHCGDDISAASAHCGDNISL